jgi:hypothetical protein
LKNFSFRKSVWNKYIPTVEANALYSYFDNKTTIDLPATTVPIISSPLFEGKSTFDNYGIFLMAV